MFLDVLFPNRCIECGEIISKEGDCMRRVFGKN